MGVTRPDAFRSPERDGYRFGTVSPASSSRSHSSASSIRNSSLSVTLRFRANHLERLRSLGVSLVVNETLDACVVPGLLAAIGSTYDRPCV